MKQLHQIQTTAPIEVGGRKMLIKANLRVLEYGSTYPIYDLQIENWTAFDDKNVVCIHGMEFPYVNSESCLRDSDCMQPSICSAIAFNLGKWVASNQSRLLTQ